MDSHRKQPSADTPQAADATPSLNFPSITVDNKLATLASESITMRVNSKKFREELSSRALDESAYEVLGDSAFFTSDDEDGRTESLASYEGHTPDDISSIADTEDSYDSQALEGREDEEDENRAHPSVYQPLVNLAEEELGMDSGLTTKADIRSLDSNSVHFGEDSDTSQEEDEEDVVQQVIDHFEAPHIPEDLRSYRCSRITTSIRYPVARQGPILNRPFRILYLGDPNNTAKQQIISKIASVLAVNRHVALDGLSNPNGSSRLNVVPISSFGGMDGSPDIELIDSTGIELLIDQCTEISDCKSSPDANADVRLVLNDREEIVFTPPTSAGSQPGMIVKSSKATYEPPDLAILIQPSYRFAEESSALWSRGNLRRACNALNARSVPFVVIDMSSISHEPLPSFLNSQEVLHLRIEGRRNGEVNDSVLCLRPIGLENFLDLPPHRLNKHIAHLTGMYEEDMVDLNKSETRKSSITDRHDPLQPSHPNAFRAYLSQWTNGWHWLIVHMVVLSIIAFFLQSFFFQAAKLPTPSPAPADSNAALSSALATITEPTKSITTTLNKAQQTIPTSQESKLDVTSVSLYQTGITKSLGQPLTHPLSPQANDSDQFKLHIIGDHHFVLTPPQRFANLRRPPRLFVKVQRGSEIITAKLTTLVEGVHAVELEREQAYGLLQVELWTESKPIISQSFEVNFGSPWLKLYKWTEAVEHLSNMLKRDTVFVPLELKNLSTQLTNSIKTGVSIFGAGTTAVMEKAQNWTNVALSSGKSMRRRSLERLNGRSNKVTKDLSSIVQEYKVVVIERAVEAAHYVKRAEGDFKKMWKKAPSLRKSQPIIGARKNAKGLWKKLSEQRAAKLASKAERRKRRNDRRKYKCKGKGKGKGGDKGEMGKEHQCKQR